ncbi:MAG TPA: cupin domain-containing protein [Gaiellaceae bacterium]|nr:cupin domain-containing protein [Gaiellaceae bacterium]
MNEVELSLRARQMPPLHVHAEDEELRVLDGRLTVFAGGRQVELRAGESWVAPAGKPHTYRAESPRVRLVAATSVRAAGSYEDFLRAVAEPSELTAEDEANLAVLAGPAGIRILGAPGELPA